MDGPKGRSGLVRRQDTRTHQHLAHRLRRLGNALQMIGFQQGADVFGGSGPQQEQAVLAEPDARPLAVGNPGRVSDHQAPECVDQEALEVRAKLRSTVAVGVGHQVAVDHQRQRPPHQLVQDVLVPVHRQAADAGHHVRNNDRVVLAQVLQHLWCHDVRQREQTQRTCLGGLGTPAQEVAVGPTLSRRPGMRGRVATRRPANRSR